MKQKRYNKKILIIFIATLFIGTSVVTAVNLRVDTTDVKYNIKLQIEIPEVSYKTINLDQQDFTLPYISDFGFTTLIGKPKLPVIRYMYEIPMNSKPILSVKSEENKIIKLNDMSLPKQVVPVQPSIVKVLDAQTNFVLDQDYYKTNQFFPDSIADIAEIGVIRNHQFILVELYPLQYNPVTSELKIIKSCELSIQNILNDVEITSNQERYYSPSFEQIFNNLFENHLNIYNKIGTEQEGFLIITYNDFYEEMQPFVDWKESLGFDVTITRTSEISGGPTKENIKQYIKDAYDSWAIPPTYVLLVGDTNQIPTFTGSSSGTASDLYYATMNVGDYFPDIFIGRFPAATEGNINAMVEKTLTYEQADFPIPEYIQKAAFMASTDNYQISEGTHNYVIDTYLEPNDYICDKLYTHTYGATTQDVSDSLNDGRGLAVYSGHGATTFWADGPYFDQSNINALTNQDLYPFVCSHACVTGRFDIGECFGETWLRVPDKGAFGFWGSSANTLWDEDDILEKKMFSAWWDDNIGFIGGMTDMAKYYLYQYYGGAGYSQYYFECYNLLGDPSVTLWRSGSFIQIGDITGGLKIGTTIKSVGTEPAENIEWSINVQGGLLGLINKEFQGVITELPVGEEIKIESNLIFGLGKIKITVNADQSSLEDEGIIIGPFIIL